MLTEYGFCFRPVLGRSDCSGRLQLWVCHRDELCFFDTVYDIRHHEWDAIECRIVPPVGDKPRASLLKGYIEKMRRDMERMALFVRTFDSEWGIYGPPHRADVEDGSDRSITPWDLIKFICTRTDKA